MANLPSDLETRRSLVSRRSERSAFRTDDRHHRTEVSRFEWAHEIPITNLIVSSWAKVFEKDLFGDFEQQALKVVQRLVDEVERDAPAGLSERARAQGKLAIEDTKVRKATVLSK